MAVVVVDVEATCWPDEQPELRQRQREVSEIIEIGAVRLVGPELTIDGEYQAFVRPEQHPVLSDFCRSLTSISQADVDAAEPYAESWRRFTEWMGPAAEVQMVSWSSYDHHLFVRQCAEANLPKPGWHHVDIKAEYGRWVFATEGLRSRFRFAQALDHVGIDQAGTAHRAIDDARNTATLLRHIRAPANASLLALHTLRAMRDRAPSPTHLGHLRNLLPNAKRWFPRIRHELLRGRLAVDLGDGRGLALTPFALGVVDTLPLDDLPTALDPEQQRLAALRADKAQDSLPAVLSATSTSQG